MTNYSSIATVASANYSTTAATFTLPFTPRKLTLQNFDAAAILYVSFDGVNDHAALVANLASPSSAHTFDFAQVSRIWVRSNAGTSTKVQVIAESP